MRDTLNLSIYLSAFLISLVRNGRRSLLAHVTSEKDRSLDCGGERWPFSVPINIDAHAVRLGATIRLEADASVAGRVLAGPLQLQPLRLIDDRLDLLLALARTCLLYTSPSPRDRQKSRMPSSA